MLLFFMTFQFYEVVSWNCYQKNNVVRVFCTYLSESEDFNVIPIIDYLLRVREAEERLMYRTLAIINRGFYYFSVFSNVGFSLMFGGISLKFGSYKTRTVITRERLIMARVRYIPFFLTFQVGILQQIHNQCPILQQDGNVFQCTHVSLLSSPNL